MASTGLLGINPYQKGVNLDFSSKPVALAIQLEQKEAAKRDVLDKYFMDYEKNIDPTVMRRQDRDIVLSKLNKNKQFYLQNRDCILNPTKCGAEFQSQYLANYKDIMSDIARSKEAAKNDELVVRHWSSQKGLNAPKGFDQAVAVSHLPVNDPNYRPVDVMKYSFYKTFDPVDYTKKLQPYSVAGLPIVETDKSGKWYTKKTYKVQPQDESKVMLVGMMDYDNTKNQGFVDFIDEKFNDGITVQKLQQKYPNKPIKSPRDLAGVFALDFVPVKETTTSMQAPKTGRAGGRGGTGNTGASNTEDMTAGVLRNVWDNGVTATRNIGGQAVQGKIVTLPQSVADIGNKRVRGRIIAPDEYFMDQDGNTTPIFKGAAGGSIPQYNLRLQIGSKYGSSKGALKFTNTPGAGGGQPGVKKKKTGAGILND
jgi:hypothetical protein